MLFLPTILQISDIGTNSNGSPKKMAEKVETSWWWAANWDLVVLWLRFVALYWLFKFRIILASRTRRGNNGVSRYPRYQKIFGLTENFDENYRYFVLSHRKLWLSVLGRDREFSVRLLRFSVRLLKIEIFTKNCVISEVMITALS